jgi:hypothetical protein
MDIGAVTIGGLNGALLNRFLEDDGENESAIYALVLGNLIYRYNSAEHEQFTC